MPRNVKMNDNNTRKLCDQAGKNLKIQNFY